MYHVAPICQLCFLISLQVAFHRLDGVHGHTAEASFDHAQGIESSSTEIEIATGHTKSGRRTSSSQSSAPPDTNAVVGPDEVLHDIRDDVARAKQQASTSNKEAIGSNHNEADHVAPTSTHKPTSSSSKTAASSAKPTTRHKSTTKSTSSSFKITANSAKPTTRRKPTTRCHEANNNPVIDNEAATAGGASKARPTSGEHESETEPIGMKCTDEHVPAHDTATSDAERVAKQEADAAVHAEAAAKAAAKADAVAEAQKDAKAQAEAKAKIEAEKKAKAKARAQAAARAEVKAANAKVTTTIPAKSHATDEAAAKEARGKANKNFEVRKEKKNKAETDRVQDRSTPRASTTSKEVEKNKNPKVEAKDDVHTEHQTSGEHESISDPVGMKRKSHFLATPSTSRILHTTRSQKALTTPKMDVSTTASKNEHEFDEPLVNTHQSTVANSTALPTSGSDSENNEVTQTQSPASEVAETPSPSRSPAAEVTETQSPASWNMPDHWSRIERSGAWLPSPYVSQQHLDKLWRFLFTGYYKDVPPVPSDGGPLPVGVGINFVKFKDFNEVAGTINILLNIRLCWADERLSFNTTEFFGTPWHHGGDKLPVRSSLVWTPDIVVLNEVNDMTDEFARGSSPLVLVDDAFRNETGVNLLWSRPLDVHSKCNVDMSLYPFDVQRCDIIIGSWASSRRQMLLVTQPFFAEHTVHTSEFQVRDIRVTKRVVYTHAIAQSFTEVVYTLVLERYPHYYVINFILPTVALTLLTISTMWMSPTNVGPRVNSSTKLLLCIVSIMFITARQRPAIHGDIWLDRFQSHCLALSMAAVLETFFIDYLAKMALHATWMWPVESVDACLRTSLCAVTTVVIFSDASEVDQNSALTLYTKTSIDSTGLLVALVYIIFIGLGLSSVFTIIWFFLPKRLQHRFVGKDEDRGIQTDVAADASCGYASDGSDAPPRPWPAQIGLVSAQENSPHVVYSKCPTEVSSPPTPPRSDRQRDLFRSSPSERSSQSVRSAVFCDL